MSDTRNLKADVGHEPEGLSKPARGGAQPR